jgi:hypothetical protein
MAVETIAFRDANGATVQIEADQIGADFVQVLKLAFGADGVRTLVETAAPLPVTETAGTFAYAAGTTTGTVDVPTAARLKRVSVLAGASTATVTIGGGATITIPAGQSFDEQIPGAAVGADVVIGGSVASYYVAWVA